MAKTKKTLVDDECSLQTLRQKLKKTNKIVTKDGMVKKKAAKQFTAYQCNVCHKKFTDKYNLSSHAKLHLNEEYPCNQCQYVGKTKKYLARHKKSAHGTPGYKCAVCGRAFHHPCGLKEHSMVHTGEKPLKCEVCGKTFRVSYSLNTHMLIHKNEKPFKCSFCAYACRDTSTLRKHENRHMGIVRTFSCKICHKKFDSRPKLKYHISETHLDHLELVLKKYTCEHCGRHFKHKQNLTKHVQTVHEESPPCTCPLCGRRVKHESYLAAHLRRHFPERPHVCAHAACGKAFKDKGDLKKHAKIHSPHLQSACARCGATFARAHRLAAHMRSHGPRVKTVTCHYCDLKFFTKNYLIKHIRKKHGEAKERYECDHCGLVTFNKPGIVMHLKYGHCRDNRLYCKICKTTYKHISYLRSHYLKTHKMRYKPRKHYRKKEKKPHIEVKVEPMDDPYEDVKLSLLEVSKEEIEDEEEGNVENDLLSYSKHVLSEDLQEYLLTEEPSQDRPEQSFDAFLLKHVFHIEPKEEESEPKIVVTDDQQVASVTQKVKDVIKKAKEYEAKKALERKKKRQAKLLEKKLKREAKIMRRKRRREKFELERVRKMYNERMKKAAAEASKKEPAKKIKYFQQKTSNETNIEKEIDKSKESNHQDNNIHIHSSDKHGKNKHVDSNEQNSKSFNENINSSSDKNNEDNLNLADNNNHISSDINDRGNDNKVNEQKNIDGDSIYDKDTSVERDCINDNKDKGLNVGHHFTNENDADSVTNDKDDRINDKLNCTYDRDNGTSDEHITNKCMETNDKLDFANDENSRESGINNKDNGTIVEENDKDSGTNEKDSVANGDKDLKGNDSDDDDIDDPDDDKRDSNYEPDSEDEAAPNKKMKFRTYQCYVCFKLYQTKEELMSHCASHFEICNSTTLSKCPACGHVVSRNMASHMRDKHDMHVTIPHFNISKREDEQGSKYCYKMAETEMEIIPSVKLLNHSASMEIDKRKRLQQDRTVASTRLVKRGSDWVVEKYKVDVSYEEMPEFSEQELSKLPASGSYTERLGRLSRLARGKGVRVLFPCDACDKICQNYAALKLHGRRHDPDKKPFAPRQNRRSAKPTPAKETPQVKSTENRLAKPQPIKNKHKCDEKLKKFYETHIRGADIEFWQFLKIYNKMDRENIKDFTDLESRTDFGMHKCGDSSNPELDVSLSNTAQQSASDTDKNQNTQINQKRKLVKNKVSSKMAQKVNRDAKTDNLRRKEMDSQRFSLKSMQPITTIETSSKLGQPGGGKKPYRRVIMISKKQHMEREKAKIILREKIKGNI